MGTSVAAALGTLATVLSIINIIISVTRSKAKDDKADASEMTTVIVKLENISENLYEIKAENKSLRADFQAQAEQIIRIDESVKSAWKAINKLQDSE